MLFQWWNQYWMFFHERNFSYDKSRVQWKKLCKCIFFDSQNIQTNLQGTSKFHGNFCTFRAPLSPIVSSARPWTSSKSCVRAVSVILRRQRFLFDKFFGADSLLNALWEKFAIPPFLGLTTCVCLKGMIKFKQKKKCPIANCSSFFGSFNQLQIHQALHQTWFFWTFP